MTTKKYPRLTWSDEYSVNDPILDDQHFAFVELSNEIIELAENPEGTLKVLLKLVSKLQTLVLEHFAFEEKYLKTLDLPEARQHVKKHDEHRQKIADFVAETEKSDKSFEELADEVAGFVTNYVHNHMLGNAGTEKYFAVWRNRDESSKE